MMMSERRVAMIDHLKWFTVWAQPYITSAAGWQYVSG
jgi:hypothetical protein